MVPDIFSKNPFGEAKLTKGQGISTIRNENKLDETAEADQNDQNDRNRNRKFSSEFGVAKDRNVISGYKKQIALISK